MCAALAEYYVAGDHEFGSSLFGAETFSGAWGGFVGPALGGVRSGAVVGEGEELGGSGAE